MKRPFRVTVEYEVVVVADSFFDAMSEARALGIPDNAIVSPGAVDWPEELPRGVTEAGYAANDASRPLREFFKDLQEADDRSGEEDP